ncbi:BGTF surface domain-containing protein [Halorussus aquaticus]|uniref:BGTF surface domain-containing protein n=1 Tax=Halorussus aquaticus TaxID=2953748 RepID=A0ABD5Q5X2_9EURY|nr:BGTF surface domain-containing protein [Halorussus aquaticus]
MVEIALHRRIALALALVALVSSTAAGAPASPVGVSSDIVDASPTEANPALAQTNGTTTEGNVSATIVHDGEPLEFRPARNQNVTIRTNADAGTELNVVLRENGQYADMYDVTVSEDGTATANLDLRMAEPGTNVTVTVNQEGRKLAEATGVVTNHEVTFVHDGGRLVLETAENQTVRVRSDATPGTEFTVQVKASGEFLKAQKVALGDDGTATAAFDLSDVRGGTEFVASVRQSRDTGVEGLVVNESATVRRNGTLTVDDPASNYTIRGRVGDQTVTKLDVNVSASDSTFDASRTVTVDEGGRFNATFELSSLSAGTELSVDVGGVPRTVSELVVTEASGDATVFAFVETPLNLTVERPGEAVLVRAAPDQTIRGTTNLRPGTEIVVTAENGAMNVPNDFSLSDTATVRENGTFAATLDFGEAETGANFTVTVERGLPLAEVDGRVVNESAVIPTTTARTTTADESAASTTSTTDGSSGSSIPGFGVPVALVAVAAGLALARRN